MMKNFYVVVLVALATAICLSSCSADPRHFFALDTYIELTADTNNETLDKIQAEIQRVQSVFDVHNSNSDLSKINQNSSGENEEIASLISRAMKFTKQTDGYFDITLGKIIDLWGIGEKNYLPTFDEVADAFVHSGSSYCEVQNGGKISLKNGIKLDLGAIAKGYAAERAVEIATKNGVSEAIFSLGGNIAIIGDKNGKGYSVGIVDPSNPETSTAANISGLSDCYVVTSGGYQRFFERDGKRYSHIFGKNGYPAESDLLSVTIVCKDGAMADAYSTALYAMGYKKAVDFCKKSSDFDAILIDKDNNIFVTDGLNDKVTASNEEFRICELS